MKLLTRGSPLALVQTERIAVLLRTLGYEIDIVPVSTKGDRDTTSPLCSFGGTGAFSSCIEDALLRGIGDGAVHSLKDVPSCCREGLDIAAVCARDHVEDVLICRENREIESLPRSAVIGTSSPRRRAQILRLRPDVSVRELRGNLSTRLQKLEDGLYDAIVMARAGLDRLGVRTPNTALLPFLPAPCQGIIALEAPLDGALFPLGQRVTDRKTHLCALAERALLRTLGVGCHVPFAALAELYDETMLLRAEILECDGRDAVSLTLETTVRTDNEALTAGKSLGNLFQNEPRALRLLKACIVPQSPSFVRQDERKKHTTRKPACSVALSTGDLS